MRSITFAIILMLPALTFSRDISELNLIDTFSCTASQKVQFKTNGKSLKKARQFRIPVDPGGYVKLNSPKLNLLFEAHFNEGVNFSLKQIDALKGFPYKMKKKTDKKTFIRVDIDSSLEEQKKKTVFSLNCLKR